MAPPSAGCNNAFQKICVRYEVLSKCLIKPKRCGLQKVFHFHFHKLPTISAYIFSYTAHIKIVPKMKNSKAQKIKGTTNRLSFSYSLIVSRTRYFAPSCSASARQFSISSSPIKSTTESVVSIPFSMQPFANSIIASKASSPYILLQIS